MSETASSPSPRRFSIAHLALLVPWIAIVVGAWGPIGDNSFLWHVRAGALQSERGSVLTSDPFSFTMSGEPWLTQSWLVELLYGWGEGISQLGFVAPMILIVGFLIYLGIGLVAYRRSQSVSATAFVLVLSVIILISFAVPRPVLFSFLLMVLVLLGWDHPKLRWTLPLLFWLWASIHASFGIGLAYIGLSLLMNRDWRALPTIVASGASTLLTAHGLGVVTFLLDFTEGREALRYLTEWRRPQVDDPYFVAFLGGLVFIGIGAIRRKVTWRHLWLILPFGLLGFTSIRALPPAWIGLMPVVADSLEGLSVGSRSGLRPRLAAVFALVVLLLPFLLVEPSTLSEDRFPLEARLALNGSPVFHDDFTGGYLIFAEGPGRLVYIDDRAELYTNRLAEFVGIRNGSVDWEPVFDRDGIGQALLKVDEKLVSSLYSAGWVAVFEDDRFVVLQP